MSLPQFGSRSVFLVEFGKGALGPTYAGPAKPVEPEPKGPSLTSRSEGQRFETTNQFRYMPYTDALKLSCFRPEVKHRYMKAAT